MFLPEGGGKRGKVNVNGTGQTSSSHNCGRCAKSETEVKERQAQITNKMSVLRDAYKYESFQRPKIACVMHITENIWKLRAKLNAWFAFK